ncbi:hypothetical protein VTK56DRAFT_4185 [Thermocarpiscus australiensis]
MLLTKLGGLLELTRVEDGRYRRYPLLPSWVPDYSVPHPGDLGRGDQGGHDEPGDFGRTSSIPKPLVVDSRLIPRGTRFDVRGSASLSDPWTRRLSFAGDLYDLIVEAESLHTTNMTLDFWATLARGNIKAYLCNPQAVGTVEEESTPLPLKRLLDAGGPHPAQEFLWSQHRELLGRESAGKEYQTRSVPGFDHSQEEEHGGQKQQKPAMTVEKRGPRPRPQKDLEQDLLLHPLRTEPEWAATINKLLDQLKQIRVDPPLLGEEPILASIWDILSATALYATAVGRLGIGPVSLPRQR